MQSHAPAPTSALNVPVRGAPTPGLAFAVMRVPGAPNLPEWDPASASVVIARLATELYRAPPGAEPQLPSLGAIGGEVPSSGAVPNTGVVPWGGGAVPLLPWAEPVSLSPAGERVGERANQASGPPFIPAGVAVSAPQFPARDTPALARQFSDLKFIVSTGVSFQICPPWQP